MKLFIVIGIFASTAVILLAPNEDKKAWGVILLLITMAIAAFYALITGFTTGERSGDGGTSFWGGGGGCGGGCGGCGGGGCGGGA